jgi:hypothetical protein
LVLSGAGCWPLCGTPASNEAPKNSVAPTTEKLFANFTFDPPSSFI